MIYASAKEKLAFCDLLFESNALNHIGVLDRKGIEKAFLIGYENGCKAFEKALKHHHNQLSR